MNHHVHDFRWPTVADEHITLDIEVYCGLNFKLNRS